MTKNEKIQVNMEEITRKLLELKSQLDDYYYNVFIPEYRENTVFDTHRIDSSKVFDLIVRKQLSKNTEIMEEDHEHWTNPSEIESVSDLRSYQELVEFEKRVPDSIRELGDDQITKLIESLNSNEE
jgi:hypothetical protein